MGFDDLSLFLGPSDSFPSRAEENTLSEHVVFLGANNALPELEPGGLCIVGVPEDRASTLTASCAKAADEVRPWLYSLSIPDGCGPVYDLGNIAPGQDLADTYFALRNLVAELIKKQQTVVIIGGSQDLSYANYMAYAELEQVANVVVIDRKFDLGTAESALSDATFLSRMVLEQPNHLFNLSCIGYQTHHVHTTEVELMKKLYFETLRLADAQHMLEEVEPMVRNADMLSFDISAIRYSDMPANPKVSSNGLYGEEACRICRYAGLSDKLSSFGLYNLAPSMDHHGQSAHLAAQMLWYFIQGHASRVGDHPAVIREKCTRFSVALNDGEHVMAFLKSPLSDRWWMEVPYPTTTDRKLERHLLIPCSYGDYQRACENEMPDRWWQTYQKLG